MQPKTNGLASFLYNIAEIMNQPLGFLTDNIIARLITVLTPGEFGNADSKTLEILIRVGLALLIIPLILPVLICSILWIVFNYFGDLASGSQPFLVLKGTYQGPGTKIFANWNMASLVQPRTLVDGVDGSMLRIEMIAAQLSPFHFVCGQEMDGTAARLLSQKLSSNFAEFYSYLGKSNLPMLPSGLFFCSKEPVLSVQWMQYQGADVQTSIRRGLAIFELQNYYVATTHPDTGDDAEQTRLSEAQQALAKFASLNTTKPIIWCGDFNDDRYSSGSLAYQLIIKQFPDAIGNSSTQHIITCTDRLKHDRFAETTPLEKASIDFIGSNKLQISYIGEEYFYPLSDHSLVKGQLPPGA